MASSDFPRYSAENYAQLLQQLFRNTAIELEPTGAFLELQQAKAKSFARLEQAGFDAVEDRMPDTTVGLLNRWQDVTGLPDPCLPLASSERERRQRVVAKLGILPLQNKEDSASVVRKLLGLFENELLRVCHNGPFRVNQNRMGDRLYSAEWLTGWVWHFSSPDILGEEPFRVSRQRIGARLYPLRALNENAECLIRRYTPAHLYAWMVFQVDTPCQNNRPFF